MVTKEEYVADHFPDLDPGVKPAGNKIIVQLRTMRKKSTGGIILAHETKDFNDQNTQVARVVAVGQIAFKHRETGEEWKEGAWAGLNDIVLIPKWGGFRYKLPIPGTDDEAYFCILKDYDIEGVITDHFDSIDRIA